MDAIPENVMVMWAGSSGSIPAGWTRDSSYDGRLIRGASNGAGGGSNGGGSTHSHSGNSHTHTGTPSHTPTWPLDAPGNNMSQTGSPANTGGDYIVQYASSGGRFVSIPGHYHYNLYPGQPASVGADAYIGSGAGVSSFGSTSTSYPSGTNIPSYHTMCIVRSDGSGGDGEGFADDLIVFYNGNDPSDWTNHSGSRAKFIYGNNGGGSNAGGASHSHSGSTHTHSASGNHVHNGETGSAAQEGNRITNTSGNISAVEEPQTRQYRHRHAITTNASSWTTGNAGGGGSGSHNYMPPYRRLNAIQNTSGEDNWLEDAICMWEGSYGSIPDGWTVCDGSNSTPDMRDKFIYTADSNGSGYNSTGGSDGHSHSNPGNHTHTANHSHNSIYNGIGSRGTVVNVYSYNQKHAAGGDHEHNLKSGQPFAHHFAETQVASGSSSSITISSVGDNKPTYRTVVFIMAPTEPASGGNVAMFGSNF